MACDESEKRMDRRDGAMSINQALRNTEFTREEFAAMMGTLPKGREEHLPPFKVSNQDALERLGYAFLDSFHAVCYVLRVPAILLWITDKLERFRRNT